MNKFLLPLLILLWALFGCWWWNCVRKPMTSCGVMAAADSTSIVVPATPPIDSVKHEITKEEEVLFRPLDVYFNVNQASFKRDSSVNNFLGVAKKYLAKYPDEKLMITGHTDSDGSDEMNQTLSERRAADMKTFLIKEGFKTDHLVTEGDGEKSPVAPNDTPENKAKNRRTSVVLKK
jgi:outer membrane protein OmpA-like peptidoglycan-associated protein